MKHWKSGNPHQEKTETLSRYLSVEPQRSDNHIKTSSTFITINWELSTTHLNQDYHLLTERQLYSTIKLFLNCKFGE